MAIHDETLDKDTVLHAIDEAVSALQADEASVRSSAKRPSAWELPSGLPAAIS